MPLQLSSYYVLGCVIKVFFWERGQDVTMYTKPRQSRDGCTPELLWDVEIDDLCSVAIKLSF